MIAETAGLLSSFKALYDITNAMLGIRDSVQINTKVMELQGAIITAQQQAIAIQQSYATLETKAHELEAECMRLKDWSTEKQKYTCREVARGLFAYLQNEVMENFEPAQKYCCNCFDQGQKSLLQHTETRGSIILICPRCKFTASVFQYIPPAKRTY